MRGFLIVLAVLVVGAVGLAFYQDWFHLTVNRDKLKEDTAEAKEHLQGLGKQAKDKAGGAADQVKGQTGAEGSAVKTATGRVTKVAAADGHFLMTTADHKELTMYTDSSSRLRLNDQEVKLEQFQVEDEVKVAYDLQGGKNVATSVTGNRN